MLVLKRFTPYALLLITAMLLGINAMTLSGCNSNGGKYANMTPGQRLYHRKCASCHRLKDPMEYNDAEWVEYVHEYSRRTSKEKQQLIINYLQKANDPIIIAPLDPNAIAPLATTPPL